MIKNCQSGLLSNIALFSFVFFAVDLFVFGSGHVFSGYIISPRKLFFLMFVLSSLLLSLTLDGVSRKNFTLSIAWAVYFIVWVVLLWIFYERPFVYGVNDSLPLIGIVAFYYSVNVFSDRYKFKLLRTTVATLLLAYSFMHIIIFLIGLISIDAAMDVTSYLKFFMESGDSEVESSVFVVPQEYGYLRVYFVGTSILLLGLYEGFSLKRKSNLIGLAYICTVLLAIISSATRSLLLASFAFLLIVLMPDYLFKSAIRSKLKIFILIAMPFVLSLLMLPLLNPSILSEVGAGREISDDLRYEQFQPLVNAFTSSPVFGNGFGMSVEPVRNELGPYSYELAILALVSKIGLLGIVVAISLISITLVNKKNEKSDAVNIKALYATYFSYVFASGFNPYLFSFYGTFFFLYLLYCYSNMSVESFIHE